jgi:glutamate N-acetyltransferase/amino-acid N-acetyltransferase
MKNSVDFIPGGGVTSPRGFLAGAVSAGIKYLSPSRLDLGILYSDSPCNVAAVFTTNRVKAAPVMLSLERLEKKTATAVVMNSGHANACTGEKGMADARQMAEMAAKHVGIPSGEMLVSSTGVIGTYLPMESIGKGIERIVLSGSGGHDLAQAIMTTDTVPKEVAVKAGDFVIGGMAKGSGMIHPNLATMLCFLTTDAAVSADFLDEVLRETVDDTFNMLSVDGDNSTNDTVLIMANGRAGGKPLAGDSRQSDLFRQALSEACMYLTREIARDGEGATKLIEVKVSGAVNRNEARQAARTIITSSLVKAAVHGSDPNWGRVVAAVGRSGIEFDNNTLEMGIAGTCLFKEGTPENYDKEKVARHMNDSEVVITVDLHLGEGEATAWGCDLSEEYVTINSDYTT